MPVRCDEIIMLNIALRHPPTMALEVSIIPVKTAVILSLRASKSANTPNVQPMPVNTAGQALQCSLRIGANISNLVVRLLDGFDQVRFRAARALRYSRRCDALPFQSLIRPCDKQKVPRSGHDRTRAGKQLVGKGVSYGGKTQFVPRVVLFEKIDH